jgi:hypothetical protein
MPGIRFITLAQGLLFFSLSAVAQPSMQVHWAMLVDPDAQQFEDPYRDLTQSQFESLMALARLQAALSGQPADDERTVLEERASELSRGLQAEGLDPEWILSQRELVAERRKRAALSTNPKFDGESVELTGYLLVAPDMEDGETVAYLLPDRGVCMHLPPPVPNQLIRLDIDKLPEPLGPCINAAVRGRLTANETEAMVPIFDDTVPLWSSWTLDVSESITSGNFPAAESQSRQEVRPDRRP